MKKLLLIVCVVLLVVIGGLAVFIATFDANRYRGLVVKKLEEALGTPVRLERLSLGWRGGIALRLSGLAIYPDSEAQHEPIASLEEASAVIRLLPLLTQDVQVSFVTLRRPTLRLIRQADRTVNLRELAASAGRSSTSQPAAGAAAAGFFISSLKVEDGTIMVDDLASQPPVHATITSLDATLKNLSLIRPIDVQLRMALFSDEQNLRLNGRLHLPTNDRAGLIEALRLETDFSRLKTSDLVQAFPAFKDLGLREGLGGKLAVVIDRLPLDPKGLAELEAQIRLTDGRLPAAQFGSPVEEVTIDALAASGRIELKRLSATVAGGTVTANGMMDHLESEPQSTGHVAIESVTLDALVPSSTSEEPHLRGRLSASFQGTAQGLQWAQISQTLSGSGTLKLSECMVANLNILQEVFRRLSILPGLVETLQARLPESYKAKLTAPHTVFQPIELSVTATQGTLSFQDLRLVTETFELTGSGRLGLDGTLATRTILRIDPELSAAIIKSVNEFQYLTDAQGRLELPVELFGALPRVAVMPDVRYVASRIVVTKAQDLLTDFLQKTLERKESTDGGTP